jgi:hypothetical protein
VALGRREVKDDPDGWVPPVSGSVREEEVGVGWRDFMGRRRVVGRKRCGPVQGKKERGRGGRWVRLKQGG